MMTNRPAPRWYVPPGISAPRHLPPGMPRIGLLPGAGPDHAGGDMLGGPFRRDEPGWHECVTDGWWCNLTGCQPGDLLRLAPIDGRMLTGPGGAAWRVPVLIAWDAEASGWTSTAERIRTATGYQVPEPQAGISARLGRLLTAITAEEAVSNDDADQLCVDILALNYHVTIQELIAARWLGEVFRAQVLTAAVYTGAGDGV